MLRARFRRGADKGEFPPQAIRSEGRAYVRSQNLGAPGGECRPSTIPRLQARVIGEVLQRHPDRPFQFSWLERLLQYRCKRLELNLAQKFLNRVGADSV
jgi:hypothetical protein